MGLGMHFNSENFQTECIVEARGFYFRLDRQADWGTTGTWSFVDNSPASLFAEMEGLLNTYNGRMDVGGDGKIDLFDWKRFCLCFYLETPFRFFCLKKKETVTLVLLDLWL